MKKTACRVIGAVLFLAVGICILARVSEILRTKTAKDRVHSLYALDRESIDVLVLGSSHGYSSIQPNVFWHDYGIPCFCMCSAEQSVPSSYYLLLEALRYQKPKVVLLESNYMYLEEMYSKQERLHDALDGIRMGRVKLEALNDFLFSNEAMSFRDRLTYYLPFVLYHSRWDELMPYDFHATELYQKGGIQNYGIMPIEDPGVPDVTVMIPEVPLAYFEKIRRTCEENGIQLVVYAAPFGIWDGDVERYRNWMGVNNSLETYLEEEGIPFLYYHKIPEAGIDFSVHFRDETHMNTYGAARLSTHLAAYLSEQFGLQDHRQEPAYRSWDEGYEKYRKAELEGAEEALLKTQK